MTAPGVGRRRMKSTVSQMKETAYSSIDFARTVGEASGPSREEGALAGVLERRGLE